jgi:hypothetical protein
MRLYSSWIRLRLYGEEPDPETLQDALWRLAPPQLT